VPLSLPCGQADGHLLAGWLQGRETLGDFGLSAWQQGAWNFAYGANMCPSKMEGVRGLRPLESLPAHLPGWRLSFSHR
jgi:hypothetical protein